MAFQTGPNSGFMGGAQGFGVQPGNEFMGGGFQGGMNTQMAPAMPNTTGYGQTTLQGGAGGAFGDMSFGGNQQAPNLANLLQSGPTSSQVSGFPTGWPFSNGYYDHAEGSQASQHYKQQASNYSKYTCKISINHLCSSIMTSLFGNLIAAEVVHRSKQRRLQMVETMLLSHKYTDFESNNDPLFLQRLATIVTGFVGKASPLFLGTATEFALVAASLFAYYTNSHPDDFNTIVTIMITQQGSMMRMLSSFVEAAKIFMHMLQTIVGGPKWKMYVADPYGSNGPFSMQPICEFFTCFIKLFIFTRNREDAFRLQSYTSESVKRVSGLIVDQLAKSVNKLKDTSANKISVTAVFVSVGILGQTIDYMCSSIKSENMNKPKNFAMVCPERSLPEFRLCLNLNDFEIQSVILELYRLSTSIRDHMINATDSSQGSGFNIGGGGNQQYPGVYGGMNGSGGFNNIAPIGTNAIAGMTGRNNGFGGGINATNMQPAPWMTN